MPLNRREFLGAAAAAVVAPSLVRGSSFDRAQDDIHVNGWLESFPCADEIPGIGKTTHLIHPHAMKGLVVFEQSHSIPVMTSEECDEVDACQLDLYRAMKYLLEQPDLQFNAVLNEGYGRGSVSKQLFDNARDFRAQIKAILNEENYVSDFYKQHVMRDERILSHRYGQLSTLGDFGATDILHFTHGLKIIASEDPEVEKEAEELIKTGDESKWGPVVLDGREDALLIIAARLRGKILYTVFGYEHKWGNNIDEWNENHPELPFSVLILTPESVKKGRFTCEQIQE